MGSEKLKTSDDPPKAEVNAVDAIEQLAGSYKVTAEGGISVSHEGTELRANKGETIDLPGNAARALLNEGSIERA